MYIIVFFVHCKYLDIYIYILIIVGYISYFHTIIVKNLVPMMKANDVLRYTKKIALLHVE